MGLDLYGWAGTKSVRELVAMCTGGNEQYPLLALLKFYASPLAGPWRKLDELYYIRRMQLDIELAGQPWRESRAELEHRWGIGPGSTSYAGEDYYRRPPSPMLIISSMLLPVFSRASEKCDWAQAQTGLVQAALALKTYRRQHGAYPATLSGLTAPEDPFSGKPFVYRRQGPGFKLYSLGPDLKDSKGQPIPRTNRQGRGEEGDIVWVSRR